jgi:hypothetical protein
MTGLYLDPEFGVNPYMPICFLCGESTGEIALLGRRSQKITGYKDANKAPPMAMSKEPCDKCKSRMQQGVILVGVCEEKTKDRENPYRTGHYVVVKDHVIEDLFQPETLVEEILSKRVAFVEGEVLDTLFGEHMTEEVGGQ